MKMNKQVLTAIKQVIQDWKTGTRNYSFETRGMNGFTASNSVAGEFILIFSIRIEGFFIKETMEPISLYFEKLFQTNDISNPNSNNVNADAIRLKGILDYFTKEVYKEVETKLSDTENLVTTDPLFF